MTKQFKALSLLLVILTLGACSQPSKPLAQQHRDEISAKVEEETNSPNSQIDQEAILAGDFSSLTGTWANDLGDLLVFEPEGLLSEDFEISGTQLRDQRIEMNLLAKSGNASDNVSLLLLRAGSVLPAEIFLDGGEDSSDPSRDRLIMLKEQPQNTSTFKAGVYYKVTD